MKEKRENLLVKFWKYLQKDTLDSWIVSLLLIVLSIKYIFFPLISLIMGSPLPLVVVESCSMYHNSDFENWWNQNGAWYEQKGISPSEFRDFTMKNGFSKGDIIFVWGYSDYNLGDIIVFQPNSESLAAHPIIHRIVDTNPIGTKGDNGLTNGEQLTKENNLYKIDETNISEENILGKSVLKIPLLGWVKLIWFEPFMPEEKRGFCN